MVFRNLPSYITFDAGEQALSDQLTDAWSRFAHVASLDWPTASTGTEVLDHTLHAATPHSAHCEFWRPLLASRR